MKNLLISLTLILLVGLCQAEQKTAEAAKINNPVVILHTTAGDITMELFPEKAPATVKNFLEYANSGFYDGTIFHRVIKRFMIQGGGFTENLQKKDTRDPIVNESSNRLHNERWTIAMARLPDPDSATAQFFINLRMNPSLDYQRGKEGYTVFGEVIDGRNVVQDIGKIKTHSAGSFDDLPMEPPVITSVEVK